MARLFTFRSVVQAIFACLFLTAVAAPAVAGYKVLIKEPVCTGPNYCASAEINGNGQISVSLPAYDNPSTPGIDMPASTFTGNVFLSPVVSEMCKPGTNGQPEWLQMGSNVKGVTGTLTAPGNYTLVLSFNATDNPNTVCNTNALGQETKLYARGYTITQGGRVFTTIVSNGTHHVYNLASIPEPETLLLLTAGLGAMALAWRRRR